MQFRKVNITLPMGLYQKADSLVKSGVYASFSDLVRSLLRGEIKDEGGWEKTVQEIRAEMQKSELAKLNKEEIIRELKKTRERVAS